MNELFNIKRLKSGVWVAGALTFVLIVLELVVENVDKFELSDLGKGLVTILATALITQITKAVVNRTSKK